MVKKNIEYSNYYSRNDADNSSVLLTFATVMLLITIGYFIDNCRTMPRVPFNRQRFTIEPKNDGLYTLLLPGIFIVGLIIYSCISSYFHYDRESELSKYKQKVFEEDKNNGKCYSVNYKIKRNINGTTHLTISKDQLKNYSKEAINEALDFQKFKIISTTPDGKDVVDNYYILEKGYVLYKRGNFYSKTFYKCIEVDKLKDEMQIEVLSVDRAEEMLRLSKLPNCKLKEQLKVDNTLINSPRLSSYEKDRRKTA